MEAEWGPSRNEDRAIIGMQLYWNLSNMDMLGTKIIIRVIAIDIHIPTRPWMLINI